MGDWKVGFGPMSFEIIDNIYSYAEEMDKKIMIVASINQIDTEKNGGGYVCSTEQFFDHVSKKKDTKNVMICRDHCGPYFSLNDRELSLKDAVEKAKITIRNDIENGFDLIHIDTSKCVGNELLIADELFTYSLGINSDIKFEFGTEENVGSSVGVEKYINDVQFASQFSKNVMFVVGQTGSYIFEDKQFGDLDVEAVKKLVEAANKYGVGLKEHNADYLDTDQILLRKMLGVHAINVAPEFGVIQTYLLKRMGEGKSELVDFQNLVIQSERWRKWVQKDCNDNDLKFNVAGHYCYNSDEYKRLVDSIDYEKYMAYLKLALYSRFESYIDNM